jgi:hypothetical protein
MCCSFEEKRHPITDLRFEDPERFEYNGMSNVDLHDASAVPPFYVGER